MSTPALGEGNLLLLSAGPGGFSTVMGLAGVARDAGARVLGFTAQPEGELARFAERVLVIPAQTMADDQVASASMLPMGSLYEGAQFLVFELLVCELRDAMGETPETMRTRHTNLQ